MDYSKYKELQITKENKILTITINRPNDMNAVNEQLHLEFTLNFQQYLLMLSLMMR